MKKHVKKLMKLQTTVDELNAVVSMLEEDLEREMNWNAMLETEAEELVERAATAEAALDEVEVMDFFADELEFAVREPSIWQRVQNWFWS